MNNYYKNLPEGYTVYKQIDAGDKKTGLLMNLAALALTLMAFILLIAIKTGGHIRLVLELKKTGVFYLYLLLFFAYIPLHEIMHGIAYKLLTKEKLTFGLKLTCAFCGLKEGYVNKKTALIALLSPLVVFSVIFLTLFFVLPLSIHSYGLAFLFAAHFGGCVGDIYCTVICIKAPKKLLVNDTGPKQTFWMKVEERVMEYPAVFEKAEDGYNVIVPDIFGGVTCGETLEGAIYMAKDMIKLMLKEAPGQCFPPKTLEETQRNYPGQLVVMIKMDEL